MIPADSPFDPRSDRAFRAWRDHKLNRYPRSREELIVEIGDPFRLTDAERDAILGRIRATNMAVYASHDGGGKNLVRALGRQFGLHRLDHNLCADEDAVSSVKVQQDLRRQGYIPYTDRPIAWHTDGYYNDGAHQIHAFILHCVEPAAEGGANALLDHEIAYLLLREREPRYIEALMHPEAMTIPPNVEGGRLVRPARTGPVFRILPGGRLHMRYTDRSRSIQWRDDPLTREAVAELKGILHGGSRYRFTGTLQAGQGLICNNVLHTRSAFRNGARERLLYRARYLDRVDGS